MSIKNACLGKNRRSKRGLRQDREKDRFVDLQPQAWATVYC